MQKKLNVFKQVELNRLTEYFTGNSYVAWLSREQVKIANVTFEPGCRSTGRGNSYRMV